MEADGVKGVNVGVTKEITARGKWSGVPETSTTYCPPINSKAFDIPKAREWWLVQIKRNVDKLPWKKILLAIRERCRLSFAMPPYHLMHSLEHRCIIQINVANS